MEPAASMLEIDFEYIAAQLPAKIKANHGPVLKNGVNSFHEALADFILINPGATLREKAAHFGYTSAWICTVETSDMFKAYFAERRKGVNVVIANDLPSRLAAAANLATERMIEVLDKTQDSDTIIDAFDKILQRHGYAPKAASMNVQQNNVFYLTPGDLAQARGTLIASHEPQKQIEAETVPVLPSPAQGEQK